MAAVTFPAIVTRANTNTAKFQPEEYCLARHSCLSIRNQHLKRAELGLIQSSVKRIADDRYRVGDGNIGPVNGADTHRKTVQRRRLVIGYVIREWAYQTLLSLYTSVHKPRPLSLCPPKTDAAYESSILWLKLCFD